MTPLLWLGALLLASSASKPKQKTSKQLVQEARDVLKSELPVDYAARALQGTETPP